MKSTTLTTTLEPISAPVLSPLTSVLNLLTTIPGWATVRAVLTNQLPNDRPVGVGRNTGRGFDFASLDLRLSRRFRITERVGLDLLAEGFNLFNRANFGVPNNTFGPGTAPLATFGQPTAAFDPRQVQFGLKVSF